MLSRIEFPFSFAVHELEGKWRVCFMLHLQTGWSFKRSTAQFLYQIGVPAHFVLVGAEDESGVLADAVRLVGFDQLLVEAMPAQRAPGFDDLLKSAAFALAIKKRCPRAQTAAHDFR